MNINKHHFSQFSSCLSLQNVRFRNPCRTVLPKLFYTRKHSNCSCESINFTKSAILSSDHDAETHAPPPLFRHSDVTAHFNTMQITVIGDPGFQNECEDGMSIFAVFLPSISLIEIGSDKI